MYVPLIATVLLFQMLLLPVLNYNTLRAEQKKIILQNADIIEGGESEAGSYRSVSGNVVFQHGSMTLKCDSAIDYERENKVVLKGNIVITDTAFAIYGDNGVYFPEKADRRITGQCPGADARQLPVRQVTEGCGQQSDRPDLAL